MKLVFFLLLALCSVKAISLSTWVQEGGNFDIDYAIFNPRRVHVIKQSAERHGDLVFTANEVGEYSFCFSNRMSTVVDKLVEFHISVEDEARDPDLETRNKSKVLDYGASRIYGDLYNIERFMLYFRSRENRNFATVKSNETRILGYALLESVLVISVAIIQVYSIESLFTIKKSRF
ncbi:hypothetical protein BB560_001186 [Smittium megazygosporum]|uniref:GOLD domain-containing protein n=1 Tax=Smittium megazygosporum TaxID=133381 RepID=A0A2T9ZIA3_9FUNG|nr:hypothetical protein BB560_001186 [Smittium megazygosporum]